MKKVKKIIVGVNVLCIAAAAALGYAFLHADKTEIPQVREIPAETSEAGSSVPETEPEPEPEPVYLSAAIPELSCGAITFGDNSVVFAESNGEYGFIDSGVNSDGLTLSDDVGNQVVFTKNGGLSVKKNGEEVTSFVYDRHLIEIKDGVLYYDSSPVEYSDTAFSAYKLTDEFTVECTGKGKYRIRNAEGEITDTCNFTDDCGAYLEIVADDTGFRSYDTDGYYYPVFKLNENGFVVSAEFNVYINGEELVPPGYNDLYTEPGIDNEVGEDPLEPARPPENYGEVNTHNEGLSELTAEMLEYVNEVRAQYGLEPMYGLALLDEASAVRAQELTENFSHTRPDETSYETVIEAAGVNWWYCGENIASTASDSVQEVFEAWMNSEEHRSVILDPKLKYMSVSRSELTGGKYYWSQLFYNESYVPY